VARLASPLLAQAQQQATSADLVTTTVRLAGEAPNQADRWKRERRVDSKAAALPAGPDGALS
jgi:hypothetical protein